MERCELPENMRTASSCPQEEDDDGEAKFIQPIDEDRVKVAKDPLDQVLIR